MWQKNLFDLFLPQLYYAYFLADPSLGLCGIWRPLPSLDCYLWQSRTEIWQAELYACPRWTLDRGRQSHSKHPQAFPGSCSKIASGHVLFHHHKENIVRSLGSCCLVFSLQIIYLDVLFFSHFLKSLGQYQTWSELFCHHFYPRIFSVGQQPYMLCSGCLDIALSHSFCLLSLLFQIPAV